MIRGILFGSSARQVLTGIFAGLKVTLGLAEKTQSSHAVLRQHTSTIARVLM